TTTSTNYLNSPTITLASASGSIGTSSNPILVENGSAGNLNLTANASAANQNVYIQNAAGAIGNLTIANASSAGNAFSVINSGNITTSGSITSSQSSGFVCLASSAGTINVDKAISTSSGQVDLVSNAD